MNCLQKQQKPLIIIGGATGVGKTELSIRLAKAVNGSIISADSMQVYKGFDIGSAKIRPEEMQGVRHYLIDTHEPDQEFNVFEFRRCTIEAMDDIYSRGEIPIIVGGTGFYIQSVLYDIQFSEEGPDEVYRAQLWKEAEENGAVYLHEKLRDVDPDAADAIPVNNIKRVIRALEFYKETGTRISVHNKEQRERISPYNFAYFVLNRPRETVYARINKRVDMMISEGLEGEVRNLLASGVSPECQPMKGLGYKEMCEYLQCHPERSEGASYLSSRASDGSSSLSSRASDGSSILSSRASEASRGILFTTLDECASAIKQNTRHFAKRQITWFKREKDAIWVDLENYKSNEEVTDYMTGILKERNIV